MISEEVLALEPDIIAWRRHMHQNPELSFQEVHTTAYLTEELKKIPGLTLEFPTKTGVVAVLKGVQPGPVLALRADIDALPIQEETGLPYASTVPGEDFSALQEDCPGFFVELGARSEEKGITFPHHNCRYLMDEDALKYGVEYLYQLVRSRLSIS